MKTLFLLVALLVVGCSKPEPEPKAAEPSALSKLSTAEIKEKSQVAFNKFIKSCDNFDRATNKRDKKMHADLLLIQMRQLDELYEEAERRAKGDKEKMKRIHDGRDMMKVIKKRLQDESSDADQSR